MILSNKVPPERSQHPLKIVAVPRYASSFFENKLKILSKEKNIITSEEKYCFCSKIGFFSNVFCQLLSHWDRVDRSSFSTNDWPILLIGPDTENNMDVHLISKRFVDWAVQIKINFKPSK